MLIRVHNCSGSPHTDRFNGVDYNFPVDESTLIPEEAAQHIFGMGMKDRSHQIIRLGWAPTSSQWADAMKRLDGFMFEAPPSDDEDEAAEPVKNIERPSVQPMDPGLVGMKSRTKKVMEKAA